MMCREFRDRHPAYLEGALSERALVAMQVHLAECAGCSRYDTTMRRGLMVLRSLPQVEPSADFQDRLNRRLHQARQADARAESYRGPGVGSFVATAAGVVAAGFLAAMLFDVGQPARNLRLAPVVAMRPAEPPVSPSVSPALVASVSMGLPVWPAAMMAEQAQMHFATAELGVDAGSW